MVNLRKIFAVCLAASIVLGAFALTGCSSGGETEPTAVVVNPTEAPAEAGYVFKYNGAEVSMNAKAEAVIQALGEYLSYFEAPSCAFEDMDKTYSYPGFDVTTYTVGGVDYISGVVLQDDTVETPEGITIGSTLEQVSAAYGEVAEGATSAKFEKGQSILTILFKDNTVTSVQYAAVTD